jgi:hypothetical protein
VLAPKPSQATQLASARGVAAPLSLPIAPRPDPKPAAGEAGLLLFPVAAGRSFCASWFGVSAPGLWMDLRLVDPGPQMQPRRATQASEPECHSGP